MSNQFKEIDEALVTLFEDLRKLDRQINEFKRQHNIDRDLDAEEG